MKDDKFFWNYENEPGKTLKKQYKKDTCKKPLVSIITSYYNSNEFMWQTINCVLNQTFLYWEWIIVDDGSTEKEAVKYLEEIKKIDSRIKVYHKENEGLAKGRDYAIKYSEANYVLPLDADDLIEPTYIETLYWALETNKDAAWAFTNSLGFGKYIYLVDHKFDSEKMKTENQITATALIRKDKILELNGYGVAKRYVNEDWHLWLRMLAKGEYPVHISFYGFWYRRRKQSLLSEINNENSKQNELRLKDLKAEADKIKNRVHAIVYPKQHKGKLEDIELKFDYYDNENTETEHAVLYILPQTGPDKKIFKKIKENSKNRQIYIIGIENSDFSPYVLRQEYEKFATVYDLTTFLDCKYYLGFIEYLIKTKNIKEIYIAKEIKYSKELKEKFKIKQEIEYIPSKKFYYNKILKYKIKYSLPGKVIRKIISIFK